MTKIYISNSDISINVVLGNKKNLHISFMPKSNGSSTYTTSSTEIQNALESHARYGKLFRLESSYDESKAETNAKEEVQNKEEKTKKIVVSDLAVAKNILADRFGVSRTLLRTKDAIMQSAAANGIEFEGL